MSRGYIHRWLWATHGICNQKEKYRISLVLLFNIHVVAILAEFRVKKESNQRAIQQKEY